VFGIGAAMALTKSAGALLGIGAILMATGVLAAIAVMVMVSALSTIFQSGIYVYATTGQVPAFLDRDLVDGAFVQKAKK
jgi:hypothetical protein